MELSKNFEPATTDSKWYAHWMEKGYFFSQPNEQEPYTIVMPPPNVTGVLHMGHSLNNTIQDILIRRARMEGKNACWVPGTDHASIATEAKVVQMLREKGISKSSLSRDEFLNHAWEWKNKYGGIILQQLKKLGCSADWNRTSFTMDADYYQSVINVFNILYNRGLIYRGKRMINWDVKALTALSDEEVIRKETKQKLYYLKYSIDNGNGETITIATVRPETIMGDTAICVNPTDDRYKHLHGKFAIVPLIGRKIPIITDDYVSTDFGTGALKVTPAHDMNDYQLGIKHNLEVVDIFNDNGTLNEDAQIFVGADRFEARKQIVPELEARGFLVKTEDYTSEVGYSERTNVVVEPRLSLQWWLRMEEISKKALDDVMSGQIKFHPLKFQNLYRHWMENIKDWCISRQLWWGHRIPAWFDDNGKFVVAHNEAEAYDIFYEIHGGDNIKLKQDEDCLDTWFSSWLWPFEVFKGLSDPGNKDVKYYYPTNTLVTAPEIIFFWVARMIIAGEEFMQQLPFKDVYFTGIVRDKQGRKMSKSLGNSPDLLALIDQYGADAVRFGIMISSPAGNDLLFDESSLEQGRYFNNKMWNALKLVKMWESKQADMEENQDAQFAVSWFSNRLAEAETEVTRLISQFRLSEALKTIYSLIWDDFCSWYLEWVKPGFEQPIASKTFQSSINFFTGLMQLLHPFMPFITEEIYHLLQERTDDLCVKLWSKLQEPDQKILETANLLKLAITGIRDIRNKQQLKPKDQIEIFVQTSNKENHLHTAEILKKQVNASSFSFDIAPETATTILIGTDTFFIKSNQTININRQRADMQKELEHLRGFLVSVEKKLGNEKFVANAKPEVIELERKKQSDASAKIKIIEDSLAKL